MNTDADASHIGNRAITPGPSRSRRLVRLVKYTALAVVLLPLGNACRRAADPAHLASLDSMLTATDSLTRALAAIDMERLRSLDSIYAHRREAVFLLMRDTLDKPSALSVGNLHRAMSSTLARVEHELDGVKQDLATSHVQLDHLKHDVEEGLLTPENEIAYIGQERLYLSQAADRVGVLHNSAESVVRVWQAEYPRVDSLLNARANTQAP